MLQAYVGNSALKIEIHTVLIGAFIEDGIDWKNRHGVTWPVFVSEDVDALKKYCGKPQVPCVLIENKTLGIVFRRLGEVSIEEMQEVTGPWLN
ncbi:MAG: hypothetical protein V4736_06115 [Bdellovibrionota bacterium]